MWSPPSTLTAPEHVTATVPAAGEERAGGSPRARLRRGPHPVCLGSVGKSTVTGHSFSQQGGSGHILAFVSRKMRMKQGFGFHIAFSPT